MKRLVRWLLPILILVGAAAIAVLLVVTAPEETAEPAEERAWPVAVETVSVSAHRPLLRLQGFVESPRAATLTAAVEADVASVSAREGDRVAAAEGLAHLDDRELALSESQREADVAELESQRHVEEQRIETDRRELEWERELLTLFEREAERLEDLSVDQYASPSDLDRARQEATRQRLAVAEREFVVDTAEARLEQLDASLRRASALRDRAALDRSRTDVLSPFAGRVASVEVAPGDRVRPGEPLASVYDLSALEVRATVPRQALMPLRLALAGIGVEALAEVDGETVPVSLTRFSGRAEAGQGGVDALFQVEASEHELVLGRFAALDVLLPPEPDTIVLPFEALYDAGRVYRIEGERMEAVDVQRVGQARLADGRRGVLLRSPELQTGDAVVSTQIPQAMDGLRVRIMEE